MSIVDKVKERLSYGKDFPPETVGELVDYYEGEIKKLRDQLIMVDNVEAEILDGKWFVVIKYYAGGEKRTRRYDAYDVLDKMEQHD